MDCPQSNFPFIRKKVLSGVRGGAPRSSSPPSLQNHVVGAEEIAELSQNIIVER